MDSDRRRVNTARIGPARPTLAAIAGLLAVVGMIGSVLGFWTLRTATDSERFEERIATVLRDVEVSQALSERVVDELVDTLDLAAAVDDVVPDLLGPAVDLVLAGARARLEDELAALIRTPNVAATVAAAAARAHAAAIDVILGEPVVEGVTVDGDAVRVNLLPLVGRAIGVLQGIGLFTDVELPDLDRAGEPAVQREQLATALGRELPPDFGEPIVFRSSALADAGSTVATVRDLLVLARRTFWLLLVLGFALAATSLVLSRDRWRAAAFLVAGTFAAGLAVRLVTDRAADRVPDAAESSGARTTIRALVADLEQSLDRTLVWYSVAALTVLVAAAVVVFGPARGDQR